MEQISLRIEIDTKTNVLIWLGIITLILCILSILIKWIRMIYKATLN